MDDAESSEEVVVSWAGIWVTALVTGLQGLAFYGFFLYEQNKQAHQHDAYDLYEPRQNTRPHRSPPPFEENWWKAAWHVSDEETLRCVGLDSYMFLRFLRLGARICALGTALSVILIPVYATGNATGPSTEQFNQITLAHVEAGSPRIWASILAWWMFVAFVLYELYMEYKAYAQNRYEFLAKGDVDMPHDYRYAVRVEQIPPPYRSDEELRVYFDRLFPNKVHQATQFYNTASLDKLIKERQQNIVQLEQAVAFTKAKPTKPRPQVKVDAKLGCCGGQKVDAIEHYQGEIDRLNQEIDEERSRFIMEIDAQEAQVDAQAAESSAQVDAEAADSSARQEEPIEVTATATEDAANLDDDDDDKPVATSTAFVTFCSLRAKQAAVQCELTGNPDSMVVFAAPDPKGILWPNVSVTLPHQKVLQLQAGIFWTVGILFWAIPVSFVTSIANLNSILKALGLNQVDPTSFWYGLVSGLLPVLALAILMAVLYMAIVAAATHLVRYKSMPEVDSYSLYWHQLFQFANLWLILIGGSAFNQIDALIKGPTSVVNVIATALPGASVFFVNMILVSSLGAFGLELSMLPTYGVKLVKTLIQPEAMQTQRQLDEAKKPPSITWGQQVPPVMFIFLVAVMYMAIVPIMELFALVYFAGSYLVWKHQCLHVYAQEFEGGGDATWQRLFGFLMACLYMAEVVFIAYMGIKEAPVQFILAFFPLGATIIIHLMLQRNIIKPLENLSLEVAADVDLQDGELSSDDMSGEQLYGMPSLNVESEERGPMPYRRDESPSETGADEEQQIKDDGEPDASETAVDEEQQNEEDGEKGSEMMFL